MQSTSTLKRHADLIDRMANTMGVDLEEKIMLGQLRPGDLTDAVLACTGCASPDACGHWLTAQGGITAQGPDYCRNGDLLSRLKSGKRA